ncbi:hypothetical protein BGZ73_000680 [Actinomortierella ambigua]|nr:hypothetical protein BGZ73_000680 [Actinomortierella ambigua]
MKNIIVATAAVVAFSAVASAQTPSPAPNTGLFITQPVAATVWKSGSGNTTSTGTVSYSDNNGKNKGGCSWVTAANKTFPIELYTLQDPATKLQVKVPGVSSIGTLDCSKDSGSATVTIPGNLPTGNSYSIMIKAGDVMSWSAVFTIQGATPAVTTTTAAARPTGATTTGGATKTATVPSPTPTGAATSVKAGSAMALAVIAAIGSLVL